MKYDMTHREISAWNLHLSEYLDGKQDEASWLDIIEALQEAKIYRGEYLVKMFNTRDGLSFYQAAVEIYRDYYGDLYKNDNQYDWLMQHRRKCA